VRGTLASAGRATAAARVIVDPVGATLQPIDRNRLVSCVPQPACLFFHARATSAARVSRGGVIALTCTSGILTLVENLQREDLTPKEEA
jgi:hypothetical protein